MKRLLALTLVLCAATPTASAPSGPWNAAVRDQLITQMETALRDYFFVDRVPKLRAALEANRAKLVAIDEPDAYAEAASRVLQGVTHDKHLNLFYSPIPLPADKPSVADQRKMQQFDEYADHGFAALARLKGNIGYFRLDGFAMSSPGTRHMIDEAMKELAKTDGLIVDLRSNFGGDADTVDYLLGYFFATKTQVTGFLSREHGKITSESIYTATNLGGPKYLERPVYILTSAQTISGGEQFAYDLKASKRATLVGQTTAGGANAGEPHPLTENFAIFVPDASPRNPITETNWEGTGIVPDVKTTAKDALLQAYVLALKASTNQLDIAVHSRHDFLADPVKALHDSLPDF